jgi:ankyrin repeat protein
LGGHVGVVKSLLDAGANPRAKDDNDITPLLQAVSSNFGDVAYLLVDKGSDPNDVFIDDTKHAHNLLWDSIAVGNTAFAALLVQRGARFDNKNVLLQAARKGQSDVVEALIERQAELDVDLADDEGVTALIAAASEGHIAVVSTLLTNASASVNAHDKDGTNALMAAAVRGHKEVVAMLYDKGADINAQNADGHTALHFAVSRKHR